MDRPGDLDHQPAHADDAAVDLDAVEFGDLLGQRFHDLRFMRRLDQRAEPEFTRLGLPLNRAVNLVIYPRR